MTAREQTTLIMSDGAHHTSSTVTTLFLAKDRYRRDIFDSDRLRESQWYVPDDEGLAQTSVRFDSGTYSVDMHQGSLADVDRVAQLRTIVKHVDQADRRLEPEMIEGRKCVGFEIRADKLKGMESEGIYRIWFDIETKLPVKIENELPRSASSAPSEELLDLILTLDHFEWNPRLPGNTFVPHIPEGFKRATNE